MIRTRVGYAGGTTPDPTYKTIGDHTETVEIDFDPSRVSYADLLDVFWSAHRPTSRPFSRQYMSAILTHDDGQLRLAEESRDRLAAAIGTIYTRIEPLDTFYMAEEYHQKYRLRNAPALFREMRGYYPDADDFRDSTAAARLNGFLDGNGDCSELEAEIEGYGLSVVGAELLHTTVCGSKRR